MTYTTIPGPKGTVRYKKDARFVAKKDIPADILIKLGVGMTDINEVDQEAIEPDVHKCIFCGMATNQFRLFNSEPVYVCTDDYYDKSMGQLAQKVRNGNA